MHKPHLNCTVVKTSPTTQIITETYQDEETGEFVEVLHDSEASREKKEQVAEYKASKMVQ